jgi:hypothetical protein
MARPARRVALARAANAVFFLITATYCILTYSSFAYQQFIRPRLVSSLSEFVAYHHLLHWVFLAVTVATFLPEWKTSRGRAVAWAYVAAMGAVGLFILYRPVLPAVENDSLGLWLACGFLVPPIWLAVYDHLATAREFEPDPANAGRILISAAIAGVIVWTFGAAAVPFRLGELGDYTTTSAALTFGAVVSLAVHVGIFTIVGGALALLVGAAGRGTSPGRTQYFVIGVAVFLFSTLTMRSLVFAALSFGGTAAWLVAAEAALAFTLAWSAAVVRTQGRQSTPRSALDAWAAPIPGSGAPARASVALAILPLVGFLLLRRVEKFDWNFLVQNLCVLACWCVSTALVHTLTRRRWSVGASRPSAMAALAVVAVAGVGAGGSIETTLPGSRQFVPQFVLDAYATVDPSYGLIRHMMSVEPRGSREFFAYLDANSLIQHVDVKPVNIDFARPLAPAESRPPHIFFFVVDSLRRDYVAPFNPNVHFTPSFEQFALQEYAFQRAFTRYGGTGLSMPAMWAGSMLLHKEYVLPFQPMNALEKLITVNGYRPVMSMDHITAQIVAPSMKVDELDKGRDELQYDLCTTLDELKGKLETGIAERQPIFAHTRALNLHISRLTARVGSPDPAYGGFQEPAAAAVRRMDSCFGAFVNYLKAKSLYDDSIVILTADHGDALGEANRWGHTYTMYPEIVRTPLLVHIPSRLRSRFTADLDAAAFSTDITPSLYALLGYPLPDREWPLGHSLFVPQGTDTSSRRHDPVLLASSYGPVYAVLRENGALLYIADGVNTREYAYDLSGLKAVRVGVTASMRTDNRELIRNQVARLASIYNFTPTH